MNDLLAEKLKILARGGVALRWSESAAPFDDLYADCASITNNANNLEALRNYLTANPIIQDSLDMLLAYLAISSSVRWQDTSPALYPFSRMGWYLNRWLPTFLIVDGPLGRIFKAPDSPLYKLLRSEHRLYPTLCQARDLINHDTFRLVRNGFGHWSFRWQQTQLDPPNIEMVNWETGATTIKIDLNFAEALHLASFAVFEAMAKVIFAKVSPQL